MTLARIMTLALRQLDEDPADISDYDELFREYANIGYRIATERYYKPKDTIPLRTDDSGSACTDGMNIVKIVRLTDENGREIAYDVSADGLSIMTGEKDAELKAVCEIAYPPLLSPDDEPCIPAYAHHALVDYICYRHLMNGNAAKQSRAMSYYQSFMQEMQAIRPQGSGSVTRFRNLYAVSDVRYTGG